MSKVLIVSDDTINQLMGGVGVRNWELACALAAQNEVVLAIPNPSDLKPEGLHLVSYDREAGDLRPLAEEADVIILHGFVMHFHPYLKEMGKPLAVDLYVPSLLEGLVWHDRDDWDRWIPSYEEYLRVQTELLRAGDFFFCANEKQRDYWLGWLHAQKRINPHTYRQDPTLHKLIDVVPFGLPAEPPDQSMPTVKGVHPGIAPEDRLILWSGGIWDWLDPLTLIRAVAQLAPRHPELKLLFMGTRHPNPVVNGMSMADQAIALSQELGLHQKFVFFKEWVPYQDRGRYLAEADLAVISHPNHIETHFSFRTRALDCIWAGIPIIVTQGDAIADWVTRYGLGVTVPPGDVKELAKAIEGILSTGNAAYNQAFTLLRDKLQWKRVIKPLASFCQSPAKAPDYGHYQTEVERIGRDKDNFLSQAIEAERTRLNQLRQAAQQDKVRLEELQKQIKQYQSLKVVRLYAWLMKRFRH